MIATSKLRLLQVARRQMAIDEEAWRELLWSTAGVRSSRDLDQRGFEAVMMRLESGGFRSTSKRKPLAYRAGMATPPETQLMRALWDQFTGGEGSDQTLGRWLERIFKVSSVRFVTADQAPKVIGALRSAIDKRAASRAKKTAAADQPQNAA